MQLESIQGEAIISDAYFKFALGGPKFFQSKAVITGFLVMSVQYLDECMPILT